MCGMKMEVAATAEDIAGVAAGGGADARGEFVSNKWRYIPSLGCLFSDSSEHISFFISSLYKFLVK